MLELSKAGRSLREIGTEIGVSHDTVRRWLEELGVEVDTRKGLPSRPVQPRALDAAEQLARPVEVDAPSDRAGAQEVVRSRLADVRRMIDDVRSSVLSGEMTPATFTGLVRLEGDLATRVAELAPPPETRPEDDPTNKRAADETRARLELLV